MAPIEVSFYETSEILSILREHKCASTAPFYSYQTLELFFFYHTNTSPLVSGIFKLQAIIVLTFTSRPRASDGKDPKYPLSTPLPSQIWRPKTYENEKETIISSADAKNFPVQTWADEKQKLVHAESRVLSFGTPLSSFGFTMYDLKYSLTRMSKLQSTLRFFGIYKPANANWGWDYVTSGLSRMSAEGHTFKGEDLSKWLSRLKNKIRENKESRNLKLRLHSVFMEWCMKRFFSRKPEAIEHVGIWDTWISLSLEKTSNYFRKSLCFNCVIYVVISILVAWNMSTTNGDSHGKNSKIHFFDREQQHNRLESNDGEKKDRRPTLQGALLKLFWKILKVICVIVSILVFMHWRLHSSILVQDIRSGMKLRPSFPNVTATMTNPGSLSLLPMTGVRRITYGKRKVDSVEPTRFDILIGTRFDSLYLRIVNRFLDYHTGNRIWRKHTTEASGCTERGFFFSKSDIFPVAVIDSILGKMKGKLLLQTPETGKFIAMATGDSRIFTRRALILEHSLLISELDRIISFIISEMRFESTLRSTPLALFAVGVLEGIRERIFGESNQIRALLFAGSKGNNRKMSSAAIPLLRSTRLLAPVNDYIATLKPEEIEFYKKLAKDREKEREKRRRKAASLEAAKQIAFSPKEMISVDKVVADNPKKRRARARADPQRILQQLNTRRRRGR